MAPQLEIGALLIGLFGGLALFLYGLDKLTDTLKAVAGDRMKSLLARLTTNRFKGAFAGAIITATIQSSSVTTVLVVGFISAGLLSLAQSIPIIMGAEIGTTITAQIIAFKVTRYSLVLVAVGFGMSFVSTSNTVRSYGKLVMGLGLIFFGMELMKESTSPLRDYQPFIDMMRNLRNPAMAVLFSAAFTALIQSSSATTGVIIVLASQGFLTLETGIALVFGANIGTCITAALAAIGKPREAVRAATVHILFNVTGVLIWIGLIEYLAEFVRFISPVAESVEGVARMQAETPRQIANAHTTFNLSNTLLFIGFTPLIARLTEFLIPDREMEAELPLDRRYMDDILVHTPALGLDVVRLDFVRLGTAARRMVEASIDRVLWGSAAELDELRAMDDEVDELHATLISYLGRLSVENLTESQSHRLSEYVAATNYFENIGDMIETNLVDVGKQRIARDLTISDSTGEVLRGLHEKLLWSVEAATQAIAGGDVALAQEVVDAKNVIGELVREAEGHLLARLTAEEPNRLAVFRIESELVEAMKRIYYFAKRIAKLVVEEDALYEPGVRSLARESSTPVS